VSSPLVNYWLSGKADSNVDVRSVSPRTSERYIQHRAASRHQRNMESIAVESSANFALLNQNW
jgi:hypothetical protein